MGPIEKAKAPDHFERGLKVIRRQFDQIISAPATPDRRTP